MAHSPQSAGGKATAIILRKQSLERYYKNPAKCLHCDSVIMVQDNQRACDTKLKKFCNSSCFASHNNKIRTRTRKRNYVPVKEKKIKPKFTYLPGMTKKEMFDKHKSWQSARGSIRRHAHYVYHNSNKLQECLICKYNLHYEVCHIKSVSSFDDSSKILDEINNINNLVALCPNHHWEFDNGILISPLLQLKI